MLARAGRYQLRTNLIATTEVASAVVGVIGSGGSAPSVLPWLVQATPGGITVTLVDRRTDRDGLPTCDIRFNGTAAADGYLQVFMISDDSDTPSTAGAQYSYSFYYALVSGSIGSLEWGMQIDWQDSGNAYLASSTPGFGITPASGPLVRTSYTNVLTPVGGVFVDMQCVAFIDNGTAVDCTLRLGAAQYESGASVTAFNRTP